MNYFLIYIIIGLLLFIYGDNNISTKKQKFLGLLLTRVGECLLFLVFPILGIYLLVKTIIEYIINIPKEYEKWNKNRLSNLIKRYEAMPLENKNIWLHDLRFKTKYISNQKRRLKHEKLLAYIENRNI